MMVRPGTAEILICTITWASIGTIVKEIPLPSPVIVFFRLFVGMMVVLAWLVWRRRLGELRPGPRIGLLMASGVTLGTHWVLLFEAYHRIDVATSILIVFIGPVLMAVGAPFVLRERLRPLTVAALAVAFAGISLITVPDVGEIDALGLASAVGSAVLFGALLLVDKVLTRHYSPSAIVAWQLGVASLLLSPALTAASGRELVRALPTLVLIGALHTGVMGILFFRAVRALPAQTLGVLFYLEPAVAVLFAWLALGETPSWLTLTGGLLVVAAGLAIIVGERIAAGPGGFPEPVVPQEVS